MLLLALLILCLPAANAYAGGPKIPSMALSARVHALSSNWKALSSEQRRAARALLARPPGGSRSSLIGYRAKEAPPYQTPHFLIHYVRRTQDAPIHEDQNGDRVRDFIELVGAEAERAWQKEIDEMGWPAPPGDGNLGGDYRYDIYLADITPQGAFGATAPSRMPSSRQTFIVLDNDFPSEDADEISPQDALQQTITHEFFHAIQLGMNRHFFERESLIWLAESSAMWMETQLSKNDVVADKALQEYYKALLAPIYSAEAALGGTMYGGWAYWTEVQRRFGTAAIRSIFDQLSARGKRAGTGKDRYGLITINRVLQEGNSSLYYLFTNFAVNAYLASGDHFGVSANPLLEEKLIEVDRPRRFTVSTESYVDGHFVRDRREKLPGLASSYYNLRIDDPGALSLRFTWSGPEPRIVVVVGGKSGALYELPRRGKPVRGGSKSATITLAVRPGVLQRVGVIISSGAKQSAWILGKARLTRSRGL